MRNKNQNENEKRSRGAFVLRATATAGVATAVLLGGAGGFSLWNDTLAANNSADIANGTLDIEAVTGEQWTIQSTDGVLAPGSVINPSTFKASPGDVLEYDADVRVNVTGDDMKAELVVDPASYSIDASLASYVTVDTVGSPSVSATGVQTVPVRVTVDFSDAMPNQVGQNLGAAVSIDNLSFDLNQVQ
jgi:alternate signal-mediated exported protein